MSNPTASQPRLTPTGEAGQQRAHDSATVTPMTPIQAWPRIGTFVMRPSPPSTAPRDPLAHYFPQKNIRRANFWYRLIAQLLCLATALLGFLHHYQWAFAVAVPAGLSLFVCGVVRATTEAQTDIVRIANVEVTAATEEAEAQRIADSLPCGIDDETPRKVAGHGYIYVIRFSTSVIKVGQTVHPRRRLYEHARDAAPYGARITSYWISPAHANYGENEAALIAACRTFSAPIKQEYFQSLDYLTAVRMACDLYFHVGGGAR